MRRSSRHTTIALVGVSSFATGAGVNTLDGDLPNVGPLFPVVCVTAVALTAIRRMTRTNDQRAKDLAETMRRREEEHREEMAEVRRREQDRCDRIEAVADLRVRSVYGRLDQVTGELRNTKSALEELQHDYGDLTRDYNAVVRDALAEPLPGQEARVQAAAVGYGQDGPHEHGPRRHRHRGPSPSLTVVETRDRQESV
ncbi:hypothetical protein [Streptomyces sp. NBC_00425]|uniref:hypothetical protein n=1 Tax=Streptomyces sp. NBC_00425 TaxID=2975740 RepID=UPI002E1D85EC